MTEEKQNNDYVFPEDFVRKIIEAENRYYQEVTITKVNGECPFGLKEGEVYRVTNCNTDGICGSLYKSIHSQIITLHYGGGLPWEKDQASFKGLCPEMGKVQVDVKRIEKENFKFCKTKPEPRDMTGKGMPGVDKYRVFIEIIDVANVCAWGNRAGLRYEVDPFNVGGVCGYLYSKAYDFINVYYAGKNLAWEFEPNVMNSVCPDRHNQTSFRIIREER